VRVVSLVPSVTETLLAWGVTPVAVTRFCEQPTLLTVGGTKDPELDRIVSLRPDLVIVNDEENRRADADVLESCGISLHVTHVASVADVVPMLVALGDAIERGDEGRAAAAALEAVVAAGVPAADGARPIGRRAFVPIWRRPWMTIAADTFGSSMLAACGWASAFADAADRYPTVTLDEVRARLPDAVLLPSEPYPFGPRHVAEMRDVAGDVRLVDGQDLFWWGSRTAVAIERLRAVLA
jgi:ABC-type Fe3+-hydroxamate transport system substrate-binding protein